MKLKNSTDFSDHFLRRMVSWCAKQHELPMRSIRQVQFTKTTRAYRGRAWYSGRILIRIGGDTSPSHRIGYFRGEQRLTQEEALLLTRDERMRAIKGVGEIRRAIEVVQVPLYPMLDRKYPGRKNAPTYSLHDRIEALVKVTAHEIGHLVRWQHTTRNREARIDGMAIPVLEAFRKNRENLLAEWNEPVKVREKKTIPLAEKRYAAVQDQLSRWQRKAKLAATKIKKLKRRVHYYELKIAANPPASSSTGASS